MYVLTFDAACGGINYRWCTGATEEGCRQEQRTDFVFNKVCKKMLADFRMVFSCYWNCFQSFPPYYLVLAVTVPLQLCTKLRIWKFSREKLKPPPAAALRVNHAEASFSNRKHVAVALIVPPPSQQQQQQKPVPKGLLNKAVVSIKERSSLGK